MGNENQNSSNVATESLRPAETDGELGLVGDEMDIEIATRLMGFQWREINKRRSDLVTHKGDLACIRENKAIRHIGYGVKVLPRYSSEIAAAMQLIEKMRERFAVTILGDDVGWVVCFDSTSKGFEQGDKMLPLAICRAALLTINSTASGREINHGS